MKRNSKLVALILCLFMVAAFIAACGPSDTPAAPAPAPGAPPAAPVSPPAEAPGVLGEVDDEDIDDDVVFLNHIDVIIDNNPIAVINPFSPAANPTSTSWAFIMIHDRLIERDHDTGEFVASLAHDWSTDDFQTFTFYLRDDVYFHNGERFTADDVVFTIEHAREHGAGSLAFARWSSVDTATAIDDTTLEIVLENVNADFYHDIAHPPASIVSRAALAADPDTGTHVGTGPYVLREIIPGDVVVMDRNPNFWNTERFEIRTETVTLRFIPEPVARGIRHQVGDSQLSFSTGVDDLAIFEADTENFTVVAHTFNTMQGFSFNLADPVLQCRYLRLAIMHATDRTAISRFAAGDWAVNVLDTDRGGGTIWGFDMEFRNNDIPGAAFDLERAAYYLERSEYNGEEIEIAAAIVTNIRGAQALQEQLRIAGINATVREFDSPGLNAHMADGNPQIVFLALNNTLAAGSIGTFFHSESAMNRMRMNFNNPEVDALIEAAEQELDPNVRRGMYMQIQEYLAEDPAYMIVFWRLNGVVASAGIRNVRLPADNIQVDLREMFYIVD